LGAAIQHEARALLRDLASGQTEALDDFHRLLGSSLHHYLSSRFRSLGVSVDDVYQETLIKVWRSAASYDPSAASPSTWVFAIARNTAVDHLRKSSALKAKLEQAFMGFARSHAEFQAHRETVCAGLDAGLSPLQRAILEHDLRVFPGGDDASLANELETSKSSLQAQRSKAYKRLGCPRIKRRDALAWLGREGQGAKAKLLGWRPGRDRTGGTK
jgi:RNA polymerase sigma factor (sigma-70 family)